MAGVLIAAVGSGWVFLINAASFTALLCSLCFLCIAEVQAKGRTQRTSKGLVEGIRYVAKRPDLKAILLMVFWIGTFGHNFPIFISTMSVTVFHAGAHGFGLLTSLMATGSEAGALIAAGRTNPRSTRYWVVPPALGWAAHQLRSCRTTGCSHWHSSASALRLALLLRWWGSIT